MHMRGENRVSESSSRNKNAAKAGLWYTVGNILLKGCVFFSLPIFTRILSTEDFGIYNSYIAYENLISAVLGLGLYGTIKNAKIDFQEKFDSYISSIFTLSVLVFVVIFLFAHFLYPIYGERVGFSRFIVDCLVCQSFGSYFLHFYGTKLNAEFKYKPYLIVSVFNTLGSIAISIVLILVVFPNQRYIGRIIGSATPPILIVLILGMVVLFRGQSFVNKKYWSYGLMIGLPLVPHVISQSILSQFDRIMIKDMVGASQSGIYSSIYTICTITYVICLSLDNAWTPWVFYQVHDKKEKEVRETSDKYIDLFSLLSLGFICVMPEIAKIMLDEHYWSGLDLLLPITLSNYCIFMYLMPVSIEYYHKKTAFISAGTLCAAGLNLVLNYVGIKLFGYKAAAYTTLISYFALFCFHFLIASKYNVKSILNIKRAIFSLIILIVISVIELLVGQFSLLGVLIRVLGLLVIAGYMVTNRQYLTMLMRSIKR